MANLSDLWDSRNSLGKLGIQKMMFPEGLLYDREIDHYRTTNVNEAIKLIHSFSSKLAINKKDRPRYFLDLSGSVDLKSPLSNTFFQNLINFKELGVR